MDIIDLSKIYQIMVFGHMLLWYNELYHEPCKLHYTNATFSPASLVV